MLKVLYTLLKIYTRTALHFYFKKWQIRFLEPVPPGPVIFVSNHQNAFLDALLAVCGSYRNIWFLTRGNIFGKPRVRKVLQFLKMTPVYRFRDGFGSLRRNDEVLETCVQLLTEGEPVLIFAEGNHDDRWCLRPMQKGFARIALAAEEKSNWTLGLKIVPVGIQYDSVDKDFRSRVLLTWGHPVSVKDVAHASASQTEAIDKLMAKVRSELLPLILDLGLENYEQKYAALRHRQEYKKDLVEQLASDQQIIAGLHTLPGTVQALKEKKKYPWWNPVFLYSFINHLIPWYLLRWILKNKVTDPQFNSSIKMAGGMVVVPFFYILQTAVCYSITGSWMYAALYFISLPISVLLRSA